MMLSNVSSIHVADDTFVAASPDLVARELQDRADWSRWWPDLSVTVQEDRGDKGVRWRVGKSLDGTMEVWLEPVLDGTMIHYFLHAEPVGQSPLSFPELAQANRSWRATGRAMAFEVKFRAERGRRPGEPAVSSATSG
ncbi:hypothetical protein [Hoyosella altamirensis]|uniref:hypothetical protein n=1 Tax=Hoyosella altamirensis TaxID=616997 RepID=UPI0007DB33AC|nr:hypothetical protein [Hoyosella altamirensis]